MQTWLDVTIVLKGSNCLLAWPVKDDEKIPKLMLTIAIYIFLQLAKNRLTLGQFTKTQLKTLKEMVKFVAPIIRSFLFNCFNLIVDTLIFPNSSKIAKLIR